MTNFSSKRYEALKRTDLNCLWHPFTQYKLWSEFDEPLIIEKGKGVHLIDVDGNLYLDGVSSLWCNVHGHSEPTLVEAIKEQSEKLCHSTLLGLSHVPVLELARELLPWTPEHLSRVFFADSGTTAVEAGLRIALEWWQKQSSDAAKKKTRFLSLSNAYHGDTLGSVGVGFTPALHSCLKSAAVISLQVPSPHMFRFYDAMSEDSALEASIEALSALLEKEAETIAAFIVEPLVQGAAGIWTQPIEYLNAVGQLCKKHDVLLIADEVATGFGKTGEMFAVAHSDVRPDMLVLGKGLSGGYLPISAVVTTEELFSGFVGPVEEFKTFFYGQTFAGNPLASHVAKVNLELFRKNKLLEKVNRNISYFAKLLASEIEPLSHVDEVRSFGLMVGIELTKIPAQRKAYLSEELAGWRVVKKARELGVIIRPLGNVMILMPALAMEKEDLKRLVDVTARSIRETLGE